MKYEHVKLVAKRPCASCGGTGGPTEEGRAIGDACSTCKGRGETETELLHPGEPFFLVRGCDQLAPAMVAAYAALGESLGANVEGLDELAARVREFHTGNPGLVKLAD